MNYSHEAFWDTFSFFKNCSQQRFALNLFQGFCLSEKGCAISYFFKKWLLKAVEGSFFPFFVLQAGSESSSSSSCIVICERRNQLMNNVRFSWIGPVRGRSSREHLININAVAAFLSSPISTNVWKSLLNNRKTILYWSSLLFGLSELNAYIRHSY